MEVNIWQTEDVPRNVYEKHKCKNLKKYKPDL
jgi:hypothetical protein